MREEFSTYSDLEKFLESTENFTFEYSNDQMHIFYDYKTEMREPIFSVNTARSGGIVAPYGFRLTHVKTFKNFDQLASKVLMLSQTPIYKRGEKKG